MAKTKKARIRNLYKTAAELATKNPLLRSGELALESDTRRIKAGDGVTLYNNLPYWGGGTPLFKEILSSDSRLTKPTADILRLAWDAELVTLFGSSIRMVMFLYKDAANGPYKWYTSVQPVYNTDSQNHVTTIDFEGVTQIIYFKLCITGINGLGTADVPGNGSSSPGVSSFSQLQGDPTDNAALAQILVTINNSIDHSSDNLQAQIDNHEQRIDVLEAEGVQGPKGDKGDPGPPGPAGTDGAQGPKGDTGVAGAAGAQGIQGSKGDTGAQGPIGLTGAKGDTGAAGAQGIQGPKGDTGAQGIPGPVQIATDADMVAGIDGSKAVTPLTYKKQADLKQDKIAGKGLSTNDFDNIYKARVDALLNYAYTIYFTNPKSDCDDYFRIARSIKRITLVSGVATYSYSLDGGATYTTPTLPLMANIAIPAGTIVNHKIIYATGAIRGTVDIELV